jgi:hypothetical protein
LAGVDTPRLALGQSVNVLERCLRIGQLLQVILSNKNV